MAEQSVERVILNILANSEEGAALIIIDLQSGRRQSPQRTSHQQIRFRTGRMYQASTVRQALWQGLVTWREVSEGQT